MPQLTPRTASTDNVADLTEGLTDTPTSLARPFLYYIYCDAIQNENAPRLLTLDPRLFFTHKGYDHSVWTLDS